MFGRLTLLSIQSIGTRYLSPLWTVSEFRMDKSQESLVEKTQDKDSTSLKELSHMNNTYFGATHYEIHLDMKLDYTISRFFQEISRSELETLHQLCELERTQILQSLALAVLKIPLGYLLSENRTNFIDYEENILWNYTCAKKVSFLYVFMFLKMKDAITEFHYSTKIKYLLLTHFHEELIFGIQQSHMDQKTARIKYNWVLTKKTATFSHHTLHLCNH